MINLKTRMASAILAFGIFFGISCTTLSLTDRSAEEHYERGQYQEALSAINADIESYPDSTELRIFKSDILKQIASETTPVSDRKSLYSEFRNTLKDVEYRTDRHQNKTDSLLAGAWNFEQGEGIRYLQKDDSYDEHYDVIISHFENAITIIPDSLVTYNLKSTTHYRHGETDKALKTVNRLSDEGMSLTPQLAEKQAYLLLETGQVDEAIHAYQQLVEIEPGNTNFRHGLVNAHILNKNHTSAAEHLEVLSEEYPNRVEYLEALATERYYIWAENLDKILDDTDGNLDEDTVTEYLNEVEMLKEFFNDVDSRIPSREDFNVRIASFFKDSGVRLLELKSIADDDDKERLEIAGSNQLEQSLPHWQNLSENHPDNAEYSKHLKTVFELLDMEDEAELIDQRINF